MPYHSWACYIAAAWVLVWGNPMVVAQNPSWQVGVAKRSITPREPVWMAGYAARNGPSEGVLTDLFVRSMAIKDASGNRFVVVTLDLIEIPESLRKAILAVLQKKHQLQERELLLNVSHTHGGPMVSTKTLSDWGIDATWAGRTDRYIEFLTSQIDASLDQAFSSLGPARMTFAQGSCSFAMNRRLPTPGGMRLAPNPNGPTDHEVPVLRIARPDGSLLAFLFGYGCHNTALGPTRMINGDYAGFAQEILEKDHPGLVALFLMGCGGDQDPSPRRNEEDARHNGKLLARAVQGAKAAEGAEIAAMLHASWEWCPLKFAPLPEKGILESRAKSPDGFVSRHAQWVLRSWPNRGDHPAPYQLPVQVVDLGGKVLLIALGGEPMADYSLRLKRELKAKGKTAWVAGYSNLVHAYIPTRKVLLEGGYEGTDAVIYQSLPGPFHTDIEESLIDCVMRQVRAIPARPSGQ